MAAMLAANDSIESAFRNGSYEAVEQHADDNDLESRVLEVPLAGGDDQTLEIDLATLAEDPTELCEILETEHCPSEYWVRLAYEYHRQESDDQAYAILQKALQTPAVSEQSSGCGRLGPELYLSALHLNQFRQAPIRSNDDNCKSRLQQTIIQALNIAQRIDPKYEPSVLSRAIWDLVSSTDDKLKMESSWTIFDNIIQSDPSNLLALMGKACLMYRKKNYRSALKLYQRVLVGRPEFKPDPRIGIGLCYWQLKMKQEAIAAWERAIELDENNKNIIAILAQSYLEMANETTDDALFEYYYGEALKLASRADKEAPYISLPKLTLAGYLFAKRNYAGVIKYATSVLDYTQDEKIQSDAHLWIARAYHANSKYELAMQHYQKAKSINDDNFLATIGIGQLQLIKNDLVGAKLTFERIADKHPRCIEALTILAIIYMNEVNANATKSQKAVDIGKAHRSISLLMRLIDESNTRSVDDPVLLCAQARVSENNEVETGISAMKQVIELADEESFPYLPQCYNNLAVLQQRSGQLNDARQNYERALQECVQTSGKEFEQILKTIISYNLGQLEEELGNTETARKLYTGLLQRHPDYINAILRLCFIDTQTGQINQANRKVKQLMEMDPGNVEVRAFCGWFLSKQKKAVVRNPNDDPEHRHYAQTLRHFDKYDTYSLTALGNFLLRQAREFRPANEKDKERQHRMYEKAVEQFDRVLNIDSNNAYAAQGIAIALAEEKLQNKAILVFSKVRETLRDTSVLYNMGHCLADLRQYARAIECYDNLLEQRGGKDIQVLLCLGRVWFQRGRDERDITALQKALEVTAKALSLNPENEALQFNIAFVQITIAEMLRGFSESQRSVPELEAAASALDGAVDRLGKLAKSQHPPYPADEIQQRANMGRNTLKKQLERAIQQQRDYENSTMQKLDEARRAREEEEVRKAEIQAKQERAEEERRYQIAEERRRLQELARELPKNYRQSSDGEEQGASKKKRGRKSSDQVSAPPASSADADNVNINASTLKRKRVIEEEDVQEQDEMVSNEIAN